MDAKTFVTPGPLTLDLRIPAGTIEVRATDTSQTLVELTGEREEEDVTMELTARPLGGHRLLIAHTPRTTFGWGGGSDRLRCRIELPTGAHIEGETASADLTLIGQMGSVVFRSGSGDVSFGDVEASASVKLASGDLEGGAVTGNLTIASASGDVRIGSIGGAATVRTASGDIALGRVAGSLQATTASGDLQVDRAERGGIHLRTVSGDVRVGVAPDTKVWLDLGSTTGDTISELEGSDGEGAHLEIHAASVSGDIVVRRGAGDPT